MRRSTSRTSLGVRYLGWAPARLQGEGRGERGERRGSVRAAPGRRQGGVRAAAGEGQGGCWKIQQQQQRSTCSSTRTPGPWRAPAPRCAGAWSRAGRRPRPPLPPPHPHPSPQPWSLREWVQGAGRRVLGREGARAWAGTAVPRTRQLRTFAAGGAARTTLPSERMAGSCQPQQRPPRKRTLQALALAVVPQQRVLVIVLPLLAAALGLAAPGRAAAAPALARRRRHARCKLLLQLLHVLLPRQARMGCRQTVGGEPGSRERRPGPQQLLARPSGCPLRQ